MNQYIDLKTDWGFKHLMGREPQMLSFLNSLLSKDYGEIASITFDNVEIPPETAEDRGVIFDICCTTDKGDKIIVEMQNYSHKFFKTRANFYLCRLMERFFRRGLRWGKMTEDIPRIVGIFFLRHKISESPHDILMTEETEHHDKTVFWDRMRKYFIILENFDFQKKAPPTLKDCWIEIIKNLGSDMYRIDPTVYECADSALLELIEKAKVSALTDDELVRYEAGLKALEDAVDFDELLSDSVREAREKSFAEGRSEGVAEGIAKGRVEGVAEGTKKNQIETAKKMLNMGMSIDLIAEISGLSKAEIKGL